MHPRYTRTRDMITAPEVPRLANGGVALCHSCQRNVYFAGGFLELLARRLKWLARFEPQHTAGECTQCGCTKIYRIRRHDRRRCSQCRFEWSMADQAGMRGHKKPTEWYAKIFALHAQGLNAHQISKAMGLREAKSVYAVLGRRENSR